MNSETELDKKYVDYIEGDIKACNEVFKKLVIEKAELYLKYPSGIEEDVRELIQDLLTLVKDKEE